MKNYLTTNFRSYLSSIIALFVFTLTSLNLSAQDPSITIDSPDPTVCYCVETAGELCFAVTISDGTSTVSPLSLASISWSGPNGFTSTTAAPCFTPTSVADAGVYTVTGTFNNGTVVTDEITLDIKETFVWECPDADFVFPDLNSATCDISYSFPGFTIGDVNCTGTAYTYCINMYDATGALIAGPVTGAVDNTVDDMLYEVGGLTAAGLDFGDYEVRIDLKDGGTGDVIDQCIVPVTAIESRNNLTCNDLVNFTLTNNCEGLVTPDMILEGDYCFDMFELELEHLASGTELSGTGEVMINQPGMYMATVTGQSGLSCWGQILAEDKSVPEVECQDPVTMFCAQTTFIPGASVCGYGKFTNATTTVAAGTDVAVNLTMISGALAGTVKNAWLNISGEITDISDLSISLCSPGAASTVVLADFGDAALVDNHCERPNLSICLADDGSYKPYGQFFDVDQCNAQANAYIGNFQPQNAFTGFSGDNAAGTWTLKLTSTLGVANLDVELIVLTNEGNLVSQGDIMQNMGCSSSDITIESEDDVLSDNCAGGAWTVVERTWTATNNTTETEGSCTQMITFLPFTPEDIIWPKSMDGVQSEVLDCSLLFDADWNLDSSVTDADGNPLPALTGSPSIPFGSMCGNFQFTSEDLVFDLCGQYSKKIIRKWAVLDWCTSDYVEYDQIIKIVDTEPIQMTCAPDSDQGIIVNDSEGNPILDSNGQPLLHWPATTDGHQCAGSWDIEPPLVIQNACDAHNFDFTVEFLIADADGEPPFGAEFVSFDPATGATVNGGTNPTSISNLPLGVTWLKYSVEDECGNTGECFTEVAIVDGSRPTPVCIENTVVAIGDDGCAYLPAESIDNGSWDNCGVVTREISRSQNGGFTDVLDYCCGCMMNDHMVYLRVTDAAGNSNTCVVTVEVQNNTNPSVTGGPNNGSKSCTTGAWDLFSVSEAGKETFNFTANCPNTAGFTVVATHNGNVIQAGDTFEPGECGVGSTTIKYDITDACGGSVGGSFNQSLSFETSFDGFDVTRWPVDYTIPNCVNGVEPENLPANAGQGNIRTTASGCGSNTAITYEDQIFPDVVDACYKILRTWTVIDWCIVNAPGNTVDDGKRTYTQLIKVNDSQAPVITNLNDVIGDDPSCQHLLTEDDVAYEITDNCTPPEDIQVSYEVNGTPAGSIFGRFYDSGDRITIIVADHCDNVNTFSFGVFTNDTEPPTPYCDSEVVVSMNASGQAEIWVSDFSISSTDNCDPQVEDYFINELNQETQVLNFDCDDIPNGVAQIVPVTVYFEDDSGNTNSCEVRVILQDNLDVCDNGGSSRIAGNVHTEDSEMVEDVMVELMNNNSMMNAMMTETNGNYAFYHLIDNSDYTVAPHKDDSYLNGVSTIDLVMIQRHILGLERFTSPYKVIAADTDNNGRINGVDLVELRKLILGITTKLPFEQQSWRLPVAAQTFADPMSPFPYAESIDVNNLNGDMPGQDFIAVKIGDVNSSALTSFNDDSVTKRSNNTLDLEVADVDLVAGTVVTIPVYATNMNDVIGLQTTMSFNPSAMTFAGINKAGLDLTEANLGLHNLKEGYITMSWNNTQGVTVADDEVLFELAFNVNEAGNLSEQFFLSSALTGSEAYTNDMETLQLNLNYKGADLNDFVLYQNIPNPFADNTEIRFSLPATSDVTFTVYDVNGSVILNRTSRYEGGNNSILLNSNELTSAGILYYKLETAYGTASRKMIQIR